MEADYKNQVSVVLLNADKISLNDALNVERALSGRNKSFSGAVSLIFFLCNLGRNDPTPYNLQGIKGRSNIYNLNSDELMAA
ncbi:hypothetical protein CEV31_4267 [Brucella thiophenivorans]|uniref:Uncharacterized protein n=1 Tax=Brucella thiophenivorans TaxID=571255 RepID=A0A256FTQ1_9HYPH|nr:hypothetical protein CEV31_4267 [Brucella thiophenivorans]